MNKPLIMATIAGVSLAVFVTATPASAQSPTRLFGEQPEVEFRNLADFAFEDAQAEPATDIQLVRHYRSFRPRTYGYRAYRPVPYPRYRAYGPTYRAYGPTYRYVPPYPYYGRPVYPSYGLYFRF